MAGRDAGNGLAPHNTTLLTQLLDEMKYHVLMSLYSVRLLEYEVHALGTHNQGGEVRLCFLSQGRRDTQYINYKYL
jgi:hypothetical protein